MCYLRLTSRLGLSSWPVALLARIFDVNITYSFCNGHSGVQSTRVDVNQGGNHKLMALPRRMHFAIRSGARTGRRSKCCETVYCYIQKQRAHIRACFLDRIYCRKHHCAPSTQPGEWLGICRPSANLLTLPMQPPNTPCKAHLHSFQYHPAIFAGQSCAGRVRTVLQGWLWWQLKRTSEAVLVLSPLREVELMEIPCLPSLNMHFCHATKVRKQPYSIYSK